MKKMILVLMLLAMLALMSGCASMEQALAKIGDDIEASQLDTPKAGSASAAGDWGFVITVREMATKTFTEGVPDAEITNTRVASKNGGDERVICVVEFKRDGKSGSYGFDYEKQADGSYELKRMGEGVRTDDLM